MNFTELSEIAKQTARDIYASKGYLDYPWWDSTLDDAVTVGGMLGIEIAKDRINFSGFSSQGDGACFSGSYTQAPSACAEIAKYGPQDEELQRIARELTGLQAARRLIGLEPVLADITAQGWYSHSGTMNVSVLPEGNNGYDDVSNDLEVAVAQLMRAFADWIYAQLEAEYDYLHSPECVDHYLADKEFDELGFEV